MEAIAGRQRAEQVAADLGVANWDARHRSGEFQLNWERRKSFLRNWLSFWRRETIGVPIANDVDEIALALTADAYSRTFRSRVVVAPEAGGDLVRTLHELVIRPSPNTTPADVDRMAPLPQSSTPGLTLERVLPRIASLYGDWTADTVALQIEYPWSPAASQ